MQALSNAHTPASQLAQDQANYNAAMQRETSMTATATSDINKHASSLVQLSTGYKDATTSAGDYAKSSQDVSTALQDTIARARDAATTTQGFGDQARTAATSAQGLSSNASQATAQVKNLGSAAQTTQGHLGDVNNEIRTTASAASASGGPLGAMIGNIARGGVRGDDRRRAGAHPGRRHRLAAVQEHHPDHQHGDLHLHHPPAARRPGVARHPHDRRRGGSGTVHPQPAGLHTPARGNQRFMSSPGGGHGDGTGGAGGGTYNGEVHVHHTTHVHAQVDQGVLFEAMKTETAIYAVRNGNAQQGRLAPGALPR